jgi:hypothetical protein
MTVLGAHLRRRLGVGARAVLEVGLHARARWFGPCRLGALWNASGTSRTNLRLLRRRTGLAHRGPTAGAGSSPAGVRWGSEQFQRPTQSRHVSAAIF